MSATIALGLSRSSLPRERPAFWTGRTDDELLILQQSQGGAFVRLRHPHSPVPANAVRSFSVLIGRTGQSFFRVREGLISDDQPEAERSIGINAFS